MFSRLIQSFSLTIVIFSGAYSQNPTCLSGPMEGYRGDACTIERIPTSDGFAYSYSIPTKTLKKWSIETNQIVAEWPLENPLSFRAISHDGRYVRYATEIRYAKEANTFWSSRLFDTQTGKPVPIDNMGMFAILPGNIAVVHDENRKVMLYDMNAKKVTATLGKEHGNHIDVSANGNIIAWSEHQEGKIHVYDVSKKKIIFSQEVYRQDISLSVSPNGRFVVWCGGIRDLVSNKTISIDCRIDNVTRHQVLFAKDGKTAYTIFSGHYSTRSAWMSVVLYVRQYNLETGAVLNEYKDTWKDPSRMPSYQGQPLGALTPDEQYLYYPSVSGIVRVPISDYSRPEKMLDFFGNIGATGIAQQQAKEQRAARIQELTASAKKSYENVVTSNAILQHDIRVSLYDYDPVSELAMIGNIYEGGLFNTKTGQFLATYSPEISRPGLSVTTNYNYAAYTIAPGGNLVAVISGDNATLYNKSTRIKEIKGVNILKLISQRHAIVKTKSGMLGLYDVEKEQLVVTYRKYSEQLRYKLSPDYTKILISDGSNDVLDVAKGTLVRHIPAYGYGITNKYVITDAWKPEFIDIATGERVTPANWDATRSGTKYFIDGNYIFYLGDGGTLDAFDTDHQKFVSDLPVKILGDLTFNYFGAFPASSKLFVCTSSGSVTFSVDGQDKESASAYVLDLKSGEIIPFRFHIPKAESNRIYREREARLEQQRTARAAEENAGLPECMHSLKIKPNMVVTNGASVPYYIVTNYDCQKMTYEVESRIIMNDGINVLKRTVTKGEMEKEFQRVIVSVCSKCNGSGMHTHTVDYNTTSVDNYNAHVPGGKVITTKSGSFQKTEVCPVCKGEGLVK